MEKTNIIFSYTRKQAIEDGVLIDINAVYPDECKIYKYPIAFTSELWELVSGKKAWVWDILFMSLHSPTFKMLSESTKLFTLSLPSEAGSNNIDEHTLKIVVSGGDNGEPVITVMFKNQD